MTLPVVGVLSQVEFFPSSPAAADVDDGTCTISIRRTIHLYYMIEKREREPYAMTLDIEALHLFFLLMFPYPKERQRKGERERMSFSQPRRHALFSNCCRHILSFSLFLTEFNIGWETRSTRRQFTTHSMMTTIMKNLKSGADESNELCGN